MLHDVVRALEYQLGPSSAIVVLHRACDRMGIQPEQISLPILPEFAAAIGSVVDRILAPRRARHLVELVRGLQSEVSVNRLTADGLEKIMDSRRVSEFTFMRFQISRENHAAYELCWGVARNELERSPVLLYGPVASGKTHLLHAIVNEYWDRFPDQKIHLTTGADLKQGYIDLVGQGRADQFGSHIVGQSLVLVDDFQFASGPVEQEKAIAAMIRTHRDGGNKMVVTCDRELQLLGKPFQKLFGEGVGTRIDYPDISARIRLLELLCKENDWILDDDTLEVIGRRSGNNMRRLRGDLTKVVMHAGLHGQAPTPKMVEDILGPLQARRVA